MNFTSLQILIQKEQDFGGQGCRIGDTGMKGGGVGLQNLFAPKIIVIFIQGALMKSKRQLLIRKL